MTTLEALHILVIDDEKIIREGAERILIKEGWKTTIVESGERGLALIKNDTFQVLLSVVWKCYKKRFKCNLISW